MNRAELRSVSNRSQKALEQVHKALDRLDEANSQDAHARAFTAALEGVADDLNRIIDWAISVRLAAADGQKAELPKS
jgi:uncharacterized protein Yka (UPF0111/DUF47 family)